LSFGWRISSEAKNLLILALAAMAMTQGFTGDSGSMKFYQRILDYFLVTLYSALGVLSMTRSSSAFPFGVKDTIDRGKYEQNTNPVFQGIDRSAANRLAGLFGAPRYHARPGIHRQSP
jgi:hypothetical protein